MTDKAFEEESEQMKKLDDLNWGLEAVIFDVRKLAVEIQKQGHPSFFLDAIFLNPSEKHLPLSYKEFEQKANELKSRNLSYEWFREFIYPFEMYQPEGHEPEETPRTEINKKVVAYITDKENVNPSRKVLVGTFLEYFKDIIDKHQGA